MMLYILEGVEAKSCEVFCGNLYGDQLVLGKDLRWHQIEWTHLFSFKFNVTQGKATKHWICIKFNYYKVNLD